MDVCPNIELGPIRQREYPHALPRLDTGVEGAPQLRPLALRIPAMRFVAEREDALLGARFLLLAPSTGDGGVKRMPLQSLAQGLRFHHVGEKRAAVGRGVDGFPHALLVDMHDQLESQAIRRPVAKSDHLAKFPRRIDVHQWEGRLGRIEGLHRQVQEHGGILADGIEHHRRAELGHGFPQNIYALALELLQMARR